MWGGGGGGGHAKQINGINPPRITLGKRELVLGFQRPVSHTRSPPDETESQLELQLKLYFYKDCS